MTDSIQHWLGRNRPPRVQITYDVETGGAIEMKELPFIVGILADLAGDNVPAESLKDRKFLEIDRDNFNDLLAKTIAPRLELRVPDVLAAVRAEAEEGEKEKEKKDAKGKAKGQEAEEAAAEDGERLVVNLAFDDIDDFRPERIAEQVPELAVLLDARRSLRDLAAQLDLREGLDRMLLQVLSSSEEEMKQLEGAATQELEKIGAGETEAASKSKGASA